MEQVEQVLKECHDSAFLPRLVGNLALDPGGDFYWRRDGEWHQWNPLSIGKLQQAVRTNDEAAYREFSQDIDDNSERVKNIRGLLDFIPLSEGPLPLSEIEPVEEILRRFSTGSMSFGSLSQEAHETLAIAMNRMGGKSGMQHEAGRQRPLRGDQPVPGAGETDRNQDGPGVEAG
jgi:glutamate synthase (NADPH/NADH) large chain